MGAPAGKCQLSAPPKASRSSYGDEVFPSICHLLPCLLLLWVSHHGDLDRLLDGERRRLAGGKVGMRTDGAPKQVLLGEVGWGTRCLKTPPGIIALLVGAFPPPVVGDKWPGEQRLV